MPVVMHGSARSQCPGMSLLLREVKAALTRSTPRHLPLYSRRVVGSLLTGRRRVRVDQSFFGVFMSLVLLEIKSGPRVQFSTFPSGTLARTSASPWATAGWSSSSGVSSHHRSTRSTHRADSRYWARCGALPASVLPHSALLRWRWIAHDPAAVHSYLSVQVRCRWLACWRIMRRRGDVLLLTEDATFARAHCANPPLPRTRNAALCNIHAHGIFLNQLATPLLARVALCPPPSLAPTRLLSAPLRAARAVLGRAHTPSDPGSVYTRPPRLPLALPPRLVFSKKSGTIMICGRSRWGRERPARGREADAS
ncbi:hypothetical protein DFH07DRAFT_811959 [Mycena maculata]|uniref:Uncharacterized protein n=1 Tax=Mycena maculata TaxID=230809 RepID=A0AAD7JFW5_9AGAR|nr:hypothetical protein DFH07DRAFT_811959 [Mycena maculata]